MSYPVLPCNVFKFTMTPSIEDSAALAICLLALLALSRRTASPHRKNLPPGPTPIPFLGNIFDIKVDAPWISYTEMRETYGDIVYTRALNMEIIVLNSEEVADELLEKRSRVYSDRLYIATSDLFGWEWVSSLARYGAKFRIHRRLYHQVFRSEAALTYRPRQLQKAYKMLKLILQDPTHYAGHFEVFSASVVMSVVYDYNITSHNDSVLNAMKRATDLMIRVATPERAALFGAFPFLKKLPSWVPGLGLKDALLSKQYVKDMLDTPYNHVRHNMANGFAQTPSMVSDALQRYHILEDAENPEMVTEIKASAATAYAGGISQTVASLLVFILAMIDNPEVQERAQTEIDKLVGIDRLPNFDDLPALPYVGALIREVKRWHPVTPMGVPHSNTEDDFYRGYFIPKGERQSLPNVWAMAHNPKKYPDPESFRPDRFLNPDGTRCPGRHVADASLWAAIPCILATFTIKKPIGQEPQIKWASGLASHPLPFPCQFMPRKAHDAQGLTSLIQNSFP
ncbi:cytochrome P450 [Suillus ampliporus]|nr:cytochrome P450 [Suillus ampliporus]